MPELTGLYGAHPFWIWTALAAILLATEVATGSGYLLWPAASAVVVAFVGLLRLGLPIEVLLFAILTLITTIVARRYLPSPFHSKGPDINDPHINLIGQSGEATHSFLDGYGRVFVDGKEWAAEMEAGAQVAVGSRVRVIGLKGGACLKVRPA